MLLAFWLATCTQLFFWGALFSRLAFKRKSALAANEALPPLSVVICARNEADKLAERLPAVLTQDYPSFEVIVVDHASTDATRALLDEMAGNNPHLRVVSCADERPGKKFPCRWVLPRPNTNGWC